MVNRRYTEVYDFETKDILGKTSAEIFDEPESSAFLAHDKEVLRTGKLVVCEENINDTIFMTAKFPIIDSEEHTDWRRRHRNRHYRAGESRRSLSQSTR